MRSSIYPDRLEVRHNGILFDENDTRGICGLVESTKGEDLSQIGKFGIGFKSVYAYTKSPEIYSGDKSFCIKNYVQPYSIEQREDVKDGETLFAIPFNHDRITKAVAFSQIKQRLKILGLRTLLFLRHIEEITWKIDSSLGKYSRTSKRDNNIRWINITYKDNMGAKNSDEEWLIFERPIYNGYKDHMNVEIAYLLDKDDKTNKKQIVPARDTKLVAFFPTEKQTQLKFLIQGPYQTTPSRDNIHENDWNRRLIKETAVLVAESISKIKEMDLVDVSYLNTLPIEYDNSFGGNMIFKQIYKNVCDKLLSNEALLPAYNGGYATAKQALIARGGELQNLLSLEQLSSLFNLKNAKWLDKNITRDKNPELRRYLMNELRIKEVDPEQFARLFNEDFIKKQTDEWVKNFYGFLIERGELWKKEKDGILRSKPIIRLANGRHTKPFNSEGIALAYLLGEYETLFPTVKETLVKDEKAKKILTELGLREPDIVDDIIINILPKYKEERIDIPLEENIKDVKRISETLKNISSEERKFKLLKELKEIPFLVATNFRNFKVKYKESPDIYVGEKYTGNTVLDIYFEGNENAWLLDGRYLNVIDVSTLEAVGCKIKISVHYKKAQGDGTVTISDFHGCHEQGLYGFDPGCEIEDLEYALEHINLERAKIIWNILEEHHEMIYGTVESATRQDWINSTKEEKYSKMGELLISYPWLPDIRGKFHKPSEILLSELHEVFDQESFGTTRIAEKLEFKSDNEQRILEELPEKFKEAYKFYEEMKSLSEEDKEKTIKFIKSLKVRKEISIETSIEEICKQVEGSLVTPPSKEIDNSQIRPGLTPEDEEITHKNYGNELPNRLNRIRVIQTPTISRSTKIIDIVDPKEFLLDQYNGHCQICKTKLYLGPDKDPWVNTDRLFKKIQGKYGWANMEFNVLGVCPNCQALMDHGGRNIRNVIETAKKVSRGEVAPEEVDEMIGNFHIRGLFYIIPLEMAGKESEIIYSQTHMQKLAAIFIEQSAKEEEESVLTPATAIQEGEKYEHVNDNKNLLQPLIKQAFEMAKRDDGWAYLADMGNSLRKLDPCFNLRTYGYNKLNEMIRAYEDVLRLKIRYSPPKKKSKKQQHSKRKRMKLQMWEPRVDESYHPKYE